MDQQAMVGLAGDWHGNTRWGLDSLDRFATAGVSTVLHLGDFGIWPSNSGAKYLRKIEAACARQGITLLVTPGNHEDWSRIDNKAATSRNTLGPIKWFTDHVALLPRGHRFEIQGRTFVSLGGAPSVDSGWRTSGTDWWPSEMITTEEAAEVAAGGHADVMLTHDSPNPPRAVPAVAQMIATNPQGWPLTALSYAAVGRNRMDAAFEGVQPRLLVHGHYHVRDTAIVALPHGDTCRIEALAGDGQDGNLALLDLDSLTVRHL